MRDKITITELPRPFLRLKNLYVINEEEEGKEENKANQIHRSFMFFFTLQECIIYAALFLSISGLLIGISMMSTEGYTQNALMLVIYGGKLSSRSLYSLIILSFILLLHVIHFDELWRDKFVNKI